MEERICAVSFAQAKAILDAEPNSLLLDVREEAEYITGHAQAALMFTLAEINDETADELIPDKDTPLLIYCRSGRRSREAARILADLGYTRIYDMGGLIGWPYGME